MQAHGHFHVFREIGCGITDHILRNMDLLECRRLHENERITVLIQISVGAFVDECLFDRIGGLVSLVGLDAIGDAAHFQMRNRRAFPGWMFSARITT